MPRPSWEEKSDLEEFWDHYGKKLTWSTVGTSILRFVGICMLSNMIVSKPHEFLVRTGFGIDGLRVSKNGFQFPFQTFKFINVTPENYKFSLNAMTSEKLQFILPGTMTIGPKLDPKSLTNYAPVFIKYQSSRTYSWNY